MLQDVMWALRLSLRQCSASSKSSLKIFGRWILSVSISVRKFGLFDLEIELTKTFISLINRFINGLSPRFHGQSWEGFNVYCSKQYSVFYFFWFHRFYVIQRISVGNVRELTTRKSTVRGQNSFSSQLS